MGFETVISISLALLALFCVWIAGKSSGRTVVLGVLLLSLTASGVGVWMTSRNAEPSPVERKPARPVAVADNGYVTSQTCKACHPDQYHTWENSYHSTMTQLVTPETVLGDFNNVTAEAQGHSYLLQRRGDEFWAEMDPITEGRLPTDGPGRIWRKLEMMTGSHHMQVYWFASGKTRVMEQLPVIWLVEEQKWIPRVAAFLNPPIAPVGTEAGRWNETCLRCHTTGAQPKIHSASEAYTEVAEFGIACESCHNMGAEHVRQNRSNPLRRYSLHTSSKTDETVVQPKRLPHKVDSQVCGQCHSLNGNKTVALLNEWKKSGFKYRPGDELEETRNISQVGNKELMDAFLKMDPGYIRDHFWSDGMVRVSGREYNGLIESPCFQHGPEEQRMSCLSCHTMHKPSEDPRAMKDWANDQLSPGMNSDQACLQCHGDFAKKIPQHTFHAANSSGSRCYNCHMPHTTYGLLKAIRSHEISVPSVQETLETGRPNACNQCHLDKTLEWTATHLRKWYETPKPELSEDEQTIAASILWLLKGDAGQRALAAWSYGWPEAQAASGTDWMTPFLGQLLADPYDAVRFIAFRSLRNLQAYGDYPYEFMAPQNERIMVIDEIIKSWQTRMESTESQDRSTTLINAGGKLDAAKFQSLLKQRDDTHIFLDE